MARTLVLRSCFRYMLCACAKLLLTDEIKMQNKIRIYKNAGNQKVSTQFGN